jgi:hypothetical protein
MRNMYRLSTMTAQAALALLLIASSAAIPQQAAARYTVEIVVFRNASETGGLTGALLPAPADDGVETTPATARKLTEAARRLRGAGGFRILAQTAWTQAPIVCSNATCRTVLRGASATQLALDRAGISGKVVLQRGDSLHLGIDLTIDDGGRRYRITEVRPVKVDQPQYFDHPAVGVLAVVTAGGGG